MRLARRLTLGLWCGWLLAQGAVFAPLAFALLPDRDSAGALAGAGFAVAAYGSLALALLVVALRPRTVATRKAAVGAPLLPAIILIFSHLVLRPLMHAARTAGPGGGPSANFGLLHGASSGLYLLATALVAWLWIRAERDALR